MPKGGIRFRLLILGALPATVLAFALTFWFIQTRIAELDNALFERGNIVAENLAPASIYGVFSGNDSLLQQLTDSAVQRADIVDAAIYDKQNHLRAYSQSNFHRDINHGDIQDRPTEELSHFSHPIELSILNEEKDDPFTALSEKTIEKKQVIGEVRISLSRHRTVAGQTAIIYTSSLITVLGLLFSFLLAYRLSLRISTPILDLTRTVKQVSDGNLGARSHIQALEELSDLKSGLNIMAASLEKNQIQLKEKIASATSELSQSLQLLEKRNYQLNEARKQAEKTSKQKSKFLAHMSHEIRTPMNGILGFLHILGNSHLTPTQSNQLQLIENSANNLLIIINEVLDHAELESASLKLNFVTFDLRRSVEESIALLSPLAHKKNLHLILLIDEEAPKLLDSDPIRLRQILFNLIGNAIKFSPSGQIVMRIRHLTDTPEPSLLFSISDSGGGISHKDQKNLFEAFSQAETTEEFPPPGTGLGLNIAQSIVYALGGEIGLASKEPFGTTFWFTLPSTISLHNADAPFLQKQVLLLDSNKLTSRALRQQLLSVSVSAIDVCPEKLTEIVLNGEPDSYDYLIINRDNNQLPSNLTDLEARLPVLFLSHSSQVRRDSFNAYSYLQLPCTQTALLEALSHTVDRSSDTPVTPVHEAAIKNRPQPHLHFLVADDIEINRLLLIEQIKSYWNASIVEAEDGEVALERLKEQTFDLVFLDLRMPKRNGLSTLKSLMSTPEALNHDTPFIAVTAYLPDYRREELISSGFSEIILKPIVELGLMTIVNKLLKLDRKQTQRDNEVNTENGSSAGENHSLLEDLLKKINGDQQLACSLLGKLNEELPEQVREALRLFKANALDDAKETIHKIHGSACYFEISELGELANQLEIALDHSDLKKITELFPLLEKEVARFTALCQEALR